MFTLGTEVSTPKGKGEVVYVEDGYIEVDVGGVEMSFEAPFKDLAIWEEPVIETRAPMADHTQPTPEYDPVWDTLEIDEPLVVRVAQGLHTKTAMAVMAVGGTAARWDDLNSYQKLNFAKMACGVSIDELVAEHKNRSEG